MSSYADRYATYKTLLIERQGGVATVTINRPEALNAISHELHEELSTIFDVLTDDKEIYVVVLTGAGRAFCAGGDVKWMEHMLDNQDLHLESMRIGRRVVMSILECPKPIICRLNGDAIGLGASIALLCDMVISVETARIADPHVKIGLVAGDGGALIWPQLVGYAKAKEFLLTGNMVLAPEAARLGLINYAVKPEELDAMVKKFVDKILAASYSAVAYTKHAINIPLRQAVHSVLESSLAYEGLTMLQNDDFREGVKAFLEGRAPKFKP